MARDAGYAHDHLAPLRRDRRHDDRRPRRRHGGRSDQDRIGQPHRSRLQVQPAAAHRRGARARGAIRGPERHQRSGRLPDDAMHKLVLLRHGESTWNKENRFTGWTDVDLSERGRDEAREAGRLLREGGYVFDLAYTSVLKRAIRTLWIVLDELDLMWIPVVNELAAERAALRRAAGAEQGGDRREARRGAGQDLAPQLRHPAAAADRRRSAPSGARPAIRRLCRRASCR